jgi:hypothetical protein
MLHMSRQLGRAVVAVVVAAGLLAAGYAYLARDRAAGDRPPPSAIVWRSGSVVLWSGLTPADAPRGLTDTDPQRLTFPSVPMAFDLPPFQVPRVTPADTGLLMPAYGAMPRHWKVIAIGYVSETYDNPQYLPSCYAPAAQPSNSTHARAP